MMLDTVGVGETAGSMGGTVDRRRIREQEDWAPKELQGDVGSAKLARHEVNMCRAPLCSSTCYCVPLCAMC